MPTRVQEGYALVVIFFSIVGVFGNLQFLWMLKRKPALRSKSGTLLGIQAVFHIFGLLAQYVVIIYPIFEYPIDRYNCFPYTTINLWTHLVQNFQSLVIALDLLLCLGFPLNYRHVSEQLCTTANVFALMVPTTYALLLGYYGWITLEHEQITFCNGPSSLNANLRAQYLDANFYLNIATLVVFGMVLLLFVVGRKLQNPIIQSRILRNSAIIVASYVFTMFFGAALTMTLLSIKSLEPYHDYIIVITMIPILLSFSQNFYICILRSKEYRAAFSEQVLIMTGRANRLKPWRTTKISTIC